MNAPDAIAQVGRALRVAADQDRNEQWWREFRRRQATNHVALMLAGRAMLADGSDPVARQRMTAAIDEYQSIAAALRDRVNKGMQP